MKLLVSGDLKEILGICPQRGEWGAEVFLAPSLLGVLLSMAGSAICSPLLGS